jgi:hypothetical protein
MCLLHHGLLILTKHHRNATFRLIAMKGLNVLPPLSLLDTISRKAQAKQGAMAQHHIQLESVAV